MEAVSAGLEEADEDEALAAGAAKAAYEAEKASIKAAVRATLEKETDVLTAMEVAAQAADLSVAYDVAATVEVLRCEDEFLEESQRNLLETSSKSGETAATERVFETRLYDARGRRRYGPRFSRYRRKPPPVEAARWWPWGSASIGRAERKLAHANFLKQRAKLAADPKAAALEAGAAFAEAAAAAAREDTPESATESVSVAEKEARTLLTSATEASNVKTVLRRATRIAVIKETLRRRELLRPEQRAREEARARRRHARELAAERRRQRERRAAAHLALLRDALRARGAPGGPATRTEPPDVAAAASYAERYLAFFTLCDDDATDEDEGDDYAALCRYFCGNRAVPKTNSSVAPPGLDCRVAAAAGDLFDREHATRDSDTAITQLGMEASASLASASLASASLVSGASSPIQQQQQGSRVSGSVVDGKTSLQSSSQSSSESSRKTQPPLSPPPSRAELLEKRREALVRVHALFQERGVRHLDGDLSDPNWRPNSESHLGRKRLGRLADVWRRVLEEYMQHRDPETATDSLADLLSALAALRVKAGDIAAGKELFRRAALERGEMGDSLPELKRLEADSIRTRQAPPTGSFLLPGAGNRSKGFRFDRALRAATRRVRPRDVARWNAPLPDRALPTASWRVLPFPRDAITDQGHSSILVRTHCPAGYPDVDANDPVAAVACRDPIKPDRSPTLLKSDQPFIYSLSHPTLPTPGLGGGGRAGGLDQPSLSGLLASAHHQALQTEIQQAARKKVVSIVIPTASS